MLGGQRVVVTRASHQAPGLITAFTAAGATVAALPLIELAPADDRQALHRAARDAGGFDWLVFTSANAVDAFLPLIEMPARRQPRCAVVGASTAAALRRRGVQPALTATVPRARGLVADLVPRLAPGARILIPQADDARPDLARGLEAAGACVSVVRAYRKRLPTGAIAAARRLFRSEVGWATCTSPRIARHLARCFGDDWPRRRGDLRAISIGPVTSAELRRLGVEPAAEAKSPSDRAMVEATLRARA